MELGLNSLQNRTILVVWYQIKIYSKGENSMQISVSELKTNVGKYIDLADTQDIYITKNGKPAARLTSAKIDRVALMESLFGIIPSNIDFDEFKLERILK